MYIAYTFHLLFFLQKLLKRKNTTILSSSIYHLYHNPSSGIGVHQREEVPKLDDLFTREQFSEALSRLLQQALQHDVGILIIYPLTGVGIPEYKC